MQVRLIEEAKVDFKKDARSAKRSGKSVAVGADQQRISAQLAADRAERAAAAPVERGSTAQVRAWVPSPLGPSRGSGRCCEHAAECLGVYRGLTLYHSFL